RFGRMALPPGPGGSVAAQTARLLLRPVSYLERCRREHGGTFTLRIVHAGTAVFISDPPSIKALFSADRVNVLPAGRNAVLEPLLGGRSLLLLNGDEHLSRRKLMLPPFHGERMRSYERAIEEVAGREVDSWPAGDVFALHPAMQAITLDVIMRAVFGVSEERRGELRSLLLRILAATRSPAAIGLTIRGVRDLGPFRRIRRTIEETDQLLAAEIAARRAAGDLAERTDILSLLISARDENGEGMSDRELRDQLMTLLMAGHETTATALAWAFDLLLQHPAAMTRLREEVAADGHEYLDAVIEETLRLRPVVPWVGRELREQAQLGGHELPAATVVMAAIYLAHTRPDVYDDPYAFRPERFLDEAIEAYGWIPFGGGTRRCIGASFAQLEMRVVLRTVLRRVALAPGRPRPEPVVRRNVTLAPRHGTPAIVGLS
ncbi:MAG: cytochrome P450, partial [Actinomycetota bacterium]|nr:cytochrome P450 [Actinomycetota bacterium]